MQVILRRIWQLRQPALALSVSLVVFAAIFAAACTNDQDTPAAEAPQSTAASAVPTTAPQPNLAAQAPTSVPSAAEPVAAAAANIAVPSKPSAPSIQVVTSTNFVADWARVVGGDTVEVYGLLRPGADPHTFVPGARDVAKVEEADVVLTVGIGLEADWLHDLIHNARADESVVVELGESVDPIEFSGPDLHGHGEEHEDDHSMESAEHKEEEGESHKVELVGFTGDTEDEHEAHDHGALDPHFWFDPLRVKIAVFEIATQYSVLDPENATAYFQNASEYGDQLDELHSWIKVHVENVPQERRELVTSHDSLSYLAKAYGFEVVGLVIPSLATHVEPSAEHIADLIEVIREHEVPAVFGETTVSEKLAQAIARETGAELVQLYSGSLGVEGSSADTYLGMVRTNVERIVEALK